MIKQPDDFKDIAAERAVLAGICRYGGDAFVDVEDLLDANTFSDELNSIFFKCCQQFYYESLDRKLDVPSFLSTAKDLGFADVVNQPDSIRHLRSLFNFPIEKDTVRREAQKLYKETLKEELDTILNRTRVRLRNIPGDASLNEILGTVENPVFEFVARMNDSGTEGPAHISQGVDTFLDDLEANPRDNIGLSSGFAKYDYYIGGGFRRGAVHVVGARMKVGKATCLDSVVFTPTGPIRMGDIAVGDTISNPWGTTTTVTSIHPQGVIDIYRVVFGDRDSVECSLDHLWEVRHCKDKKYSVMSLQDIVDKGLIQPGNGQRKWHVRLPEFCYYNDSPVTIEPYLLGLLLGNGGMTSAGLYFTSADEETKDRLRNLLYEGHHLVPATPNPKNDYHFRIIGCNNKNLYIKQLRELGLWGKGSYEKFIPDVYKYNSLDIRMSLLQGLCDTDGSADKRGYIEYTTTSRRLAYDIKEVVQSVGGLCNIKYRKTRCQTGEFWSYRLHIKHNDPGLFFRLTRKKERTHLRTKLPLSRTILRVEYIGKKEAQCIKLASDDGLYLTDNHIVTHNTVFCDNIGLHVAGNLGIPVLNLDTEMTREQHIARILSHVCGSRFHTVVTIREIETGKYGRDEAKRRAVRNAAAWLKTIPYEYDSVAEKSFEEQIAIMRRWTRRRVGTDDRGRANDSLIIYDYLQPPEPGTFGDNYKEYQLLGFQMLSLLRTAVKCDVPIFTLVQLNRDGIDKESTAVAADSDRVLRKGSDFTILKWKNEEEIAEHGRDEGTHKLVPIVSRFGEAMEKGDYINIKFESSLARMTEGKTRNEVEKSRKATATKGFEAEGAADEEVKF